MDAVCNPPILPENPRIAVFLFFTYTSYLTFFDFVVSLCHPSL